jgi:hypothetical protein
MNFRKIKRRINKAMTNTNTGSSGFIGSGRVSRKFFGASAPTEARVATLQFPMTFTITTSPKGSPHQDKPGVRPRAVKKTPRNKAGPS